ncbi:MAG: DUF6291 domain-containing protein [Bacillota bacterium]
MKKKSFQLYNDYREIFDGLTREEAGALIQAIFAHESGEEVQLGGMLRIIFIPIRQQLNRDREKYESVCERNAENGAKGGRPKASAPAGITGRFSTEPQKADTGTDTDKDTGKDTDKESEIAEPPAASLARARTAPRFSPPTVDEVRAYCAQTGSGVNPQRFVDFYASKGWMVGKSPMKDWKAAVRSWNAGETAGRESARPKPMTGKYSEVI